MEFVVDRAAGGLGVLRFGMTADEAAAALDGGRQRPGPRAAAVRDSGLHIAPGFGGPSSEDGGSRVVGVTLTGPPSSEDRVTFGDVDLFAGSLEEVVGQLRDRGYDVVEHTANLYGIHDADVWLILERWENSDSTSVNLVRLVVGRPGPG